MKTADIIGFGAILGGGYYIGYKQSQGTPYTATDYFIIALLLIAGFYFAVILS